MPEHYLGIDVGHSEDNPTTGLCLITLEHGHFRWRCRNTKSQKARRLADLRGLIPEGTAISAVGIDGPLTTDFQLINRYRAADAFLSRGAFQKRCKPGPVDVPRGQLLHYHATELAKLVLELNEEGYLHVEDAGHPDRIHQTRVVEAFPNAFLGVLLEGARCDQICDQLKGTGQEKKSDEFWKEAVGKHLLHDLIGHLVPQIGLGELDTIIDHDHRAAFVCALAGLCVAKNRYVSVGDPVDGNICLPPFKMWGVELGDRWGEVALRKNLPSLKAGKNLAKYPHHGNAVVFSNGAVWH